MENMSMPRYKLVSLNIKSPTKQQKSRITKGSGILPVLCPE